MLSLPVQKDIGEYQEKLVAGLSATALAALGAGVAGAALVVFVGMVLLHLPDDPVYIVAAAFVMAGFAFGFIKPLGLPMQKAIPVLIRTYMGSGTLTYSTSVALAMKKAEKEGIKDKKKEKGAEKDVRTRKISREHADDRAERGAASPEWVLPRAAGWSAGPELAGMAAGPGYGAAAVPGPADPAMAGMAAGWSGDAGSAGVAAAGC